MSAAEVPVPAAPSAAMRQLAGLVLEDGRRWGEVATDHQVADAVAILDPAPGDPLFHFVTRPRGGSKTTDLAGIVLAVLLTQQAPGSKSYGAAADGGQAALILEAIEGFVQRTPGLVGSVKITGRKVTDQRTSASFEVMSYDLEGSWGKRPAFLVVDEVAQHGTSRRAQRFFDALHSSTGKVAGARMVLLTSAGDDVHWAHKLLERARSSSAWRVSEMPGPVPWADPAWLAEQRAMLPDWLYARLHENRWVGADDRLTTPEQLRACVTLDGPLKAQAGTTYVVSLDLGVKNDRTVACVTHLEQIGGGAETYLQPKGEYELLLDGMVQRGAITDREAYQRLGAARRRPTSVAVPVRVVLDRIEVWQGTRLSPVRLDAVENWVLQAHDTFNQAPVIMDPWQTIGMAQRLRARGIVVDEFTFSSTSVGRLASTLHLLLRDGALALPDDPDLLEELANVRLVERSAGVVRMDHDAGRHDDRAQALALGALYLLDRRPVASTAPWCWSYTTPDFDR